jgi:selenophosphate synthase
MSYLHVDFWPGGTEEQYQAMIKAVHPENGLPEGQRSHTSGPTDGGYLIAVVWDSEEQSQSFMQNTLLAALPVAGGFEGAPQSRFAQVAHHDSL